MFLTFLGLLPHLSTFFIKIPRVIGVLLKIFLRIDFTLTRNIVEKLPEWTKEEADRFRFINKGRYLGHVVRSC
jgi:hypothetical protein